jgi:hypothetical protein
MNCRCAEDDCWMSRVHRLEQSEERAWLHLEQDITSAQMQQGTNCHLLKMLVGLEKRAVSQPY